MPVPSARPGDELATLRSLLEHAFDPMLVYDADLVITYASPAIERALGYRPDEMIGRRRMSFVPPEDEAALAPIVESFAASPGETLELRFPIMHKNGRVLVFDCLARNMLDNPFVQGIVFNARDVTDRVEAERARDQSESLSQRIVTLMSEGVWILDTHHVFRFANPALEALLGHAAGTIDGRAVSSVVVEDDVAALHDALNRLEPGRPYRHTCRLLAADGTTRWVQLVLSVLGHNAGGEPDTMAIVTDVSELRARLDRDRQLDAQLLQAQKLDGLGALAGGVAHQFNNLLTVILGNTGLAHRSLPPNDPAGEKLDNVMRATREGGELIGQLLAYAGKGHVEQGPVHMNDLFESVGHLLEAAVPKGALLRFELDPEVPMVFGDPALLQQVALNLVTNAGEALVDGQGTITVRTTAVEAGEGEFETVVIQEHLPPGLYLQCEVIDTGEGISRGVRSRMFEPFFSTRRTGRGLGLASVLGIVRSHRGSIEVHSETGGGTTIRVLLPTTDQPIVAGPPGAATTSAPTTDTTDTATQTRAINAAADDRPVVLVVDDDRGMRVLCTRVLEPAGFTVTTAATGAEAVQQYAAADRIDVVLLDLTMPGMTGQETQQALLGLDPGARIVFMSGYSESEIGEWYEPGPFSQFIAKPFDIDGLVAALRSVLTTQHRTTPEEPRPAERAVINVLVVDDHAMVGQAFASIVDEAPNMHIVAIVPDGEHAMHVVTHDAVDVVLMDYNLPTADGVKWAHELKAQRRDLKILILTGSSDTDTIVARAVNEGCDGFLSKTAGLDRLAEAIEHVHAGEPVFTPSELLKAIRHFKQPNQHSLLSLSEREIEVLQLMAGGASATELGRQLYISVHTVRSHIRHVLEKLDAHSKLEAVAIAVNQGIITMPQPAGDP